MTRYDIQVKIQIRYKNLEIEDDGGRYITKSLKVKCDDVITEPMHSKEEKFSVFIGVWLMELLIYLFIHSFHQW